MSDRAFQDDIPNNYCWGCGRDNPHGLHLRSFWDGDASVCSFQPTEAHAAGPRDVVNGGIIATIVDCHCIGTAIAAAYRAEGRAIGSEPWIWYVTAALNVTYVRPAPLGEPLTLRATITSAPGRKAVVSCTISAGGEERAHAEVVAVRVPAEWGHGRPLSGVSPG